MRKIHRQSKLYPTSKFPMCRFGMSTGETPELTTDDTKVTCKKCLRLMKNPAFNVRAPN